MEPGRHGETGRDKLPYVVIDQQFRLTSGDSFAVEIVPALRLCETVARERHIAMRWRFSRSTVDLAEAPDQTALTNIEAQFEAAMQTILIDAAVLPQSIIFLLNQSGEARGAEDLIHGTFRQRITRANFIASCDLGDVTPNVSGGRGTDPLVIWIDDPTCVVPYRNPFSNPIKKYLFRRFPLLLDDLRQRRTRYLNRRAMAALKQRRRGRELVYYPPASSAGGAYQRTILFCLYWLDLGGAEAFAIRAMEAARTAGYRVVVTCDELGRHRLLGRARQHADAIYMLGDGSSRLTSETALLAIVRRHRPNILHIHHSWTAYRMLPPLRSLGLLRGVVDTTHIVEHRFGGFVFESMLYSEYIDSHHVISEQLARTLTETGHVEAGRVRLGKLHDLSKHFKPAAGKWERLAPLSVAFVGRFSQQKRPYVFIEIVRRLVRAFGPERFVFQAIGEGPLRPACEDLATRSGVAQAITFLPGHTRVDEVLAEAHVLIVPSDNEGLTLVAFEAIRARCLVISTRVGAQSEIVIDDLLVPDEPHACVRGTVRLLSSLARGEFDVDPVLQRQDDLLLRNTAGPGGAETCLHIWDQMIAAQDVDVSAA